MTLDDLYYAAMNADAVYSAELQRLYGARAGDARYDSRGIATPELRQLAQAAQETFEAYRATFPRWMPVDPSVVRAEPPAQAHRAEPEVLDAAVKAGDLLWDALRRSLDTLNEAK